MELIKTHAHVNLQLENDFVYLDKLYVFNSAVEDNAWYAIKQSLDNAWFIKNPSKDIRNQPSVGKVEE